MGHDTSVFKKKAVVLVRRRMNRQPIQKGRVRLKFVKGLRRRGGEGTSSATLKN